MWINSIEDRINRLNEKLEPVEIKRLQLEYLPTVARRIALEAEKCQRCDYLKRDIEEALTIVEKAEEIKESHRRAYNTKIKGIISHLRSVHGLKSKSFYSSQYSNLGLIGGILAGIWFMDQFILMIAIVLTGPVLGKLIGSFRDKRNTENLI